MVKELTLSMLLKGVKQCESYHDLHEYILHELGEITKTDEAIHTKNLWRASQMRLDPKQSKMKFIPYKFPPSRIEDEYAEWRHLEKKDSV